MANEDNRLLSIPEAMARMGIKRTAIYSEINAGKLEARKFGRRTLIPAQSIQSWIENLPSIQGAQAAQHQSLKEATQTLVAKVSGAQL